ncbi:MAG: aminoacetone oxidase family FAD-binding enzyme [Clostridiales bacterium]|nr:aminoacetone oxidase family FAD-binding enzyme [Clostridiales bacterium]
MDVIIIGAGAAGLTAAIFAAGEGADVLVLNHHAVPGKKLLSTGNGKCNFTNEYQDISCYRSDDDVLVKKVLDIFCETDTMAFFHDIGIAYKQKNGYYYPISGQASSVREALISKAGYSGTEIINGINISSVEKTADGFTVDTEKGIFGSKSLILATGGMAAPSTGSDGSGYELAKSLGHSIISPLPALVPLITIDRWLRNVAGVRCDAKVTLLVDGKASAENIGELQLNASQLSGIPVFQVSRYASIALKERKRVELAIDFYPRLSEIELANVLAAMAESLGGYKNWREILAGLIHTKLAGMIADRLKLSTEPVWIKRRAQIPADARKITSMMKQTMVNVTGTGYMTHAQATCGGVPLNEIGGDMQSQFVHGLYFAGEILNVDGICGGYNLQWAWSSGAIAGQSAAKAVIKS